MIRLETFTRGACVAVVSIVIWCVAVGVIVSGGYLITVSTPCLCFDANGFMLLAGLAVILAGAALMLWASDIANRITGRALKRLFHGRGHIDSPV